MGSAALSTGQSITGAVGSARLSRFGEVGQVNVGELGNTILVFILGVAGAASAASTGADTIEKVGAATLGALTFGAEGGLVVCAAGAVGRVGSVGAAPGAAGRLGVLIEGASIAAGEGICGTLRLAANVPRFDMNWSAESTVLEANSCALFSASETMVVVVMVIVYPICYRNHAFINQDSSTVPDFVLHTDHAHHSW